MLFFAARLVEEKGEQGESNAEGMGCTQQELQQPCSLYPRNYGLYWFSRQKQRLFHCQNFCSAFCDVNGVFKLANISSVDTAQCMVGL